MLAGTRLMGEDILTVSVDLTRISQLDSPVVAVSHCQEKSKFQETLLVLRT